MSGNNFKIDRLIDQQYCDICKKVEVNLKSECCWICLVTWNENTRESIFKETLSSHFVLGRPLSDKRMEEILQHEKQQLIKEKAKESI